MKKITVTWQGKTTELDTTGVTLFESIIEDWPSCEIHNKCFCNSCDLDLLCKLQTQDPWQIITSLKGKKQFYCLYKLISYLNWDKILIIMEICAPCYEI